MSRRKLFLHNDELINQKAEERAEELWNKLIIDYPLKESSLLNNLFKNIKHITYAYIAGFTDFHKKFDENFCITAIHKTQNSWAASLDINQCLNKRSWLLNNACNNKWRSKFTIYYIDHQFDIDYPCPHGDDYKDVYLMFFTEDEKQTAQMLEKFNRLKAFV